MSYYFWLSRYFVECKSSKMHHLNKNLSLPSKNLNYLSLKMCDLRWRSYGIWKVVFTVLCLVMVCSGEREAEAWKSHASSKSSSTSLNIGLIVPKTNFGVREYIRAVNTAVGSLHRGRGTKLNFLKQYGLTPKNVNFVMFSLTPSPTGNYEYLYALFLIIH